ncbi:Uncharacterised protein [Yersinia enterocolitica]|nr:Uncharacterised protein [Yersinia enterocolitica]
MNPDELTPVNDSGERKQPTHMQLEVSGKKASI